MHTQKLEYNHGATACEALAIFDDAVQGERPCVLVLPAWHGPSEFDRDRAERLARLGYVGIVADVYGKGVRGDPHGDNSHLMSPFLDDRILLRDRLLAGLKAAGTLAVADAGRMAAIGFCFGGLCALDLARCNAPGVRLAVSFHGVYGPPQIGDQMPIDAKILVCHGMADPFSPAAALADLQIELADARASWDLLAFGGVAHAFTHPDAASPQTGLQYDAAADRISWRTATDYLASALGMDMPDAGNCY